MTKTELYVNLAGVVLCAILISQEYADFTIAGCIIVACAFGMTAGRALEIGEASPAGQRLRERWNR